MPKGDEVIAAIGTPAGRGAIGIVRLSGPDLRPYFAPLLGRVIEPRRVTVADFVDAAGQTIDRGVALYFPAPHSYTGQDVLELQGHGGPAVLALLLRRCIELGARQAEPGEFTLRAFLNDRIDLAQAEGVADLIDASSEAAARSALRSLKGDFSAQVRRLVDQLVELRALVEACIDFPEEDVELLEAQGAWTKLNVLTEQLSRVRQSAAIGSLLRDGASVVLTGRPNTGKSSLMNRLAGEDLAIVTEVPGTTRDAVRQVVHLRGVPISLVDTAGLRESADVVEQIGMDRAWAAVRGADLVLLVTEVHRSEVPAADDMALLEQFPGDIPCIVVANKIDLVGLAPQVVDKGVGSPLVYVSAKTGAGLDLLQAELLREVGWLPTEGTPFLARERHLRALDLAADHIRAAADHYSALEVFAEELRLAQRALADITGELTADDLLGEIFSRFCIGK